jgi:hypothetical protein
MSITLLTVLVFLVGVVTYMLLKVLVRPVRVVGACTVMISLAAFMVQIRATIALQADSSDASALTISSAKPTLGVPNPTQDVGPNVMLESISREDHDFLEEILEQRSQDGQQQALRAPTQVQNIGKAGVGSGNEPALKAELVMNTAEGKRSEAATHKETVKRARLVIPNGTFKRAELVRSRQP